MCFGEFGAEIYYCYGFYVGDENGNQISEAGLTDSYINITNPNYSNKKNNNLLNDPITLILKPVTPILEPSKHLIEMEEYLHNLTTKIN